MENLSGIYVGYYKDEPNIKEQVEFLILDDEGNFSGMTVNSENTDIIFMRGILKKNIMSGECIHPSKAGEFEFKVQRKKNSDKIRMVGCFKTQGITREYIIYR